jgi:hypothetical protein
MLIELIRVERFIESMGIDPFCPKVAGAIQHASNHGVQSDDTITTLEYNQSTR